MIVANVPFCTFQLTPSTLATALRRSTSRPTFTPLTCPACGRPAVPGERVVPRSSWPLDRTLAGSSAFSLGSSLTPDTTSWAGTADAPSAGADPAAPPAADPARAGGPAAAPGGRRRRPAGRAAAGKHDRGGHGEGRRYGRDAA